MTAARDTRDYRRAGCLVGCGNTDSSGTADHPEFCERSVGSMAAAVTEPKWLPTQLWCSVIQSSLNGRYPVEYGRRAERARNGVQLAVMVDGLDDDVQELVTDGGGNWRELRFNLDSGQARQLAAQLVAAADSRDNISHDSAILSRLEKVAEKVGLHRWDL